jgi:hypothetical protein
MGASQISNYLGGSVALNVATMLQEGDDGGAQAPAEEAWEPSLDDFREATPLADFEDPESPAPTRRLLRHRSSGKRIADDYVDPTSINLDDEAMLYVSEPKVRSVYEEAAHTGLYVAAHTGPVVSVRCHNKLPSHDHIRRKSERWTSSCG